MTQPEKTEEGKAANQFLAVFDSGLREYFALEVVGQGGAGIVYEAADSSGGIFAVKCLNPGTRSSDTFKRFTNEIRFCSPKRHKNIIEILDHGKANINGQDRLFYVMPYYSETLRELRKSGLRSADAVRLFSQLLDDAFVVHLP
jgi:serine/threonine protein kinase